ncbi:hypothetical protein N8Z47_03985 [Salibacteraceae bacterium]|nr:hypothetical protein [Salibacteraceae bacterium]|tara:strand:+ start:307 stop:456 length:150 start_codon:yes stop_codon:yes gene_type:complete
MILYIGPGLGAGTIALVFIVLLIIVGALGMILWIPLKRFFKKLFGKGQG